MASRVCSRRRASRAASSTRAPEIARYRPICAPIPALAPVITAVRPRCRPSRARSIAWGVADLPVALLMREGTHRLIASMRRTRLASVSVQSIVNGRLSPSAPLSRTIWFGAAANRRRRCATSWLSSCRHTRSSSSTPARATSANALPAPSSRLVTKVMAGASLRARCTRRSSPDRAEAMATGATTSSATNRRTSRRWPWRASGPRRRAARSAGPGPRRAGRSDRRGSARREPPIPGAGGRPAGGAAGGWRAPRRAAARARGPRAGGTPARPARRVRGARWRRRGPRRCPRLPR